MTKTLINIAFSTFVALVGTAASAEETDTIEVMQTIEQMAKLHASLKGKTVTMNGAIGTMIGDTLYFKNDHGQFKVQFDAGRNARKLIEGCELEWFGWANSDCIVEVDAEIEIDTAYDFADGGEIKLIVYEVRR